MALSDAEIIERLVIMAARARGISEAMLWLELREWRDAEDGSILAPE